MTTIAALGRTFDLRADRQFKAGLDLVASSAIGAVLGLAFWLVAARSFDEGLVGRNAALISSMTVVAGISNLGLQNALVRFVPAFGQRAPWLIRRSYLVAGTVAVALGIGSGWALGRRFDDLDLLRSWSGIAVFAAACLAWQIFALQDSVLVALGRSRVVPIENAVFSVAKLVLVAGVVLVLPTWGIFVAWVAPLALIIVGITVVIVRQLRVAGDGEHAPAEALGTSELVRFSIGEHTSALVWMGAIGLLPLIVLDRLGDEANAFYATGWAVAYNLFLVSVNIGTALLAETAHEPALVAKQQRAAFRQMAMLVAPAALVLVIFAPQVLAVFGSTYASEGTATLRLLALAAVAHIPVAVAQAGARAERRMVYLALIIALEVVLVLAISTALIGSMGVTGVGLGWLLAELAASAVVTVVALVGRRSRGETAVRPTQDRPWWSSEWFARWGHLGVTWQAVIIVLLAVSGTSGLSTDDLGIVSVLPPMIMVVAVLAVISAVIAVFRNPLRERFVAGHVAAVVVLISAVPSVAYETVRYSWAFKHIGIVDYIVRNGGVDREIDVLNVYHNWPGFFAATATASELGGLGDTIGLATWAPLWFNLAILFGLVAVLGHLTTSRRTVWLATLLFFVTNWIGQDYFAPQALGLVLYLLLIALVLRFYRRHRSTEPTLLIHAIFAAATLALVMTHQLTPLFLLASLAGLALLREVPFRLPLFVGSTFALWTVLGAWPFFRDNVATYVDTVGSPAANTARSFGLAASRSDGQVVVALAGRAVLVGILGVALVGAILAIRRTNRDLTPFALLAGPAPWLLLQFGGEILFRVALFTLPVLALFAARALMQLPNRWRLAASAAVAVAAFIPFTIAYYGKDSFYTFTDDEVALVRDLSLQAPTGSLLVEGSRNYPAQFIEYEKFVYVPIAAEPTDTVERVRADPAEELFTWLSDDRWAGGYVLLTDGQQAETEAVGSLPADFLPSIEAALRNDDRFVVALENSAGVVFTLSDDVE